MNFGLRSLGKRGNATFKDAEEYIRYADTNKDHEISKIEMFNHLKKILNRHRSSMII